MPAARNNQALIERAIRAWVACGRPGRGVEVTMDGTVRVLGDGPDPVASSPANGKRLLDCEDILKGVQGSLR